ncbi:MAG TPA: aldo/keto reductase [Acidimicrobiales bacterium]|nr:aldo/keto reductase [Acidimicrobiales bacterium]
MATVGGGNNTRVLADGSRVPLLGLGVWQVAAGRECTQAVRWALDIGYRHIDTAQAYGNEESVGQALRESGVPREEVFITTKFYPGRRDPAAEMEESLKRLQVDYVDLYLVHWPQGGATWAWPGMERAHAHGHARSIGVSNFDVDELARVISTATVAPVIDQVQLSPFEYRQGLIDAAEKQQVAIEAYSPLGTGQHLSDKVVVRVAQRCGRSPAQVLLRWCLQHGLIVLPKSVHRERIAENAQIFDFSLPEDEMAELDALDRTRGTQAAREGKWW